MGAIRLRTGFLAGAQPAAIARDPLDRYIRVCIIRTMEVQEGIEAKPSTLVLTLLIEGAFFNAIAQRLPTEGELLMQIRERLSIRRIQVQSLVQNELDEMNVNYTLL